MGIRLLSATERLWKLKDGLFSFFNNFTVMFGVEIFLFFLLIYYVSKVLRDNDATKLMLLYWGLILVGCALNVFAYTLVDKQFLLFYVTLLSAFMLFLFNVEVKKSLWDVHTAKTNPSEKLSSGSMETRTQAETEHCIANVIKALQNMSKNNVGALIVLSKGSLPKQVLQSGVVIEAEISTQMIEGIFFPKAQKTSYPKDYGTRHRAAIGITEVANVISLVVSEETGIISIVKQGNVTRYADYDMLVDALKDYYWQEMPLGDRKRGGLMK